MKAKYNIIGVDYNLSRKADPYLVSRFVELLGPVVDGQYVEIGCGTGNYTSALAEIGFSFIGIDPAEAMLDVAKSKDISVDWKIGTAEQTGLVDESVDGIMVSLSIHHWPDLKAAFKELNCITKAGGNMVIFTSTPEQMQGYWISHYFPNMLKAGAQQMPSFEVVVEAIEYGGFEVTGTEKYSVRKDLQDLFLYSGKHDPLRYFDEQVRKGISTFSDLANWDEVEAGLESLKKDMESGKVKDIIDSYQNEKGDYLFIQASKPGRE